MGEETIGSSLKARRVELGLDQREVGIRIGMSRTTYSSYERDTQRPSVDVFPALAQFLDVSLEHFLMLYGATCVKSVRPSLEHLLMSAPEQPHQALGDKLAQSIPRSAAEEWSNGASDSASNGGSSSIFANELSHDDAPYAARTVSLLSAEDTRVSGKATKNKKKKKGKGKRAKSVDAALSHCFG